ncbi:hypothetical protein SDC9_197263 [bioreactor metagenome]|uniref:Uncharacterized protein n=1 Tax=bioreactor metagenome TaxID=1076179 RepID=A0A645IE85_9ZZZZ
MVASSKIFLLLAMFALLAPSMSLIFTTFILFFVRVPVLSEHITCAEPRVSTAVRWRIIAFFCESRLVPIASTMVTTAVSPSGIAATARLTEVINISKTSLLRKIPKTKITMQIPIAPSARTLPVSSSFLPSGVFCSSSP